MKRDGIALQKSIEYETKTIKIVKIKLNYFMEYKFFSVIIV